MLFSRSSRFSSRRVMLFITDVVIIVASITLSTVMRLSPSEAWVYLANQWQWLALALGVMLVVIFSSGMYERDVLIKHRVAFTLPFITVAISLIIMIAIYYVADLSIVGRGILLLSGFFSFLGIGLTRHLYKLAVGRGFLSKNSLILGEDPEIHEVVDLLNSTDGYDYKVFGIISCSQNQPGEILHGYPVLGYIDKLREFADVYDIESIIVATSRQTELHLLKHLRPIRYAGIQILDYVSLKEELAQEIDIDHIDDEWLMHAAMNISLIHIRKLKRILDVTVSVLGLLFGLPLVALAAVAIKLESRGPVFFTQIRMGLDGRRYRLMKLRTMCDRAEQDSGAVWADANDKRVTKVGRWLRLWRIDEIPQLINVLKGEMSLVGPRPERPEFFKVLQEAIPYYEERLLVAPGITGWAQIKYPYASSIEASKRKLQYELYYIKHMSLSMDIGILMHTFKTILMGVRYSKEGEGC